MGTRRDRSEPGHHATKIRHMLSEASEHIQGDLGVVDDVEARALFETAREVLTGLVRAFEHYEKRERARPQARPET